MLHSGGFAALCLSCIALSGLLFASWGETGQWVGSGSGSGSAPDEHLAMWPHWLQEESARSNVVANSTVTVVEPVAVTCQGENNALSRQSGGEKTMVEVYTEVHVADHCPECEKAWERAEKAEEREGEVEEAEEGEEVAGEKAEDGERGSQTMKVLSPIIGSTLPAPAYEEGCEATIYECRPSATQGGGGGVITKLLFLNGTTTHYSEEGQGCTLLKPEASKLAILTHGFSTCSHRWRNIAMDLVSRGHTVVLPLLTGHGAAAEALPHELFHVPTDNRKSRAFFSPEQGYGLTAQAIADVVVASFQLSYSEVLVGGFSAGGAVSKHAMTLVASAGELGEEELRRVRILHVASFLDTPNKLVKAARAFHPLLVLNKLRMKGRWFTAVEGPEAPWDRFHLLGRKGYSYRSKTTDMHLLRYSTYVKKIFNSLGSWGGRLSGSKRRAAELMAEVPVLTFVLNQDTVVDNQQLLDSVASVHRNHQACGLESNSDHIPNACGEDEEIPHFCGGSGKLEEYPDGLIHDTMLDENSRAGYEPGWWLPCVSDLVLRHVYLSFPTLFIAFSLPQPLALLPPCCEPLTYLPAFRPLLGMLPQTWLRYRQGWQRRCPAARSARRCISLSVSRWGGGSRGGALSCGMMQGRSYWNSLGRENQGEPVFKRAGDDAPVTEERSLAILHINIL
ncbi:unnamed protein product [Chrysoparadoxa australica]